MSFLDWIKSLFSTQGTQPPSPPRLEATTEATLSDSLRHLPAGERGWITLKEARLLFSTKDDQYAFGELDEQGRMALSNFASRQGSTFDIMPTEGRVYFTRKQI